MISLHPRYWTQRTYLYIALFLVSINLFGARGLVHWLLSHQEATRLSRRASNTSHEINFIKNEIATFKASDVSKMRAIREQLGYLKANEGSIEFTQSTPQKEQ